MGDEQVNDELVTFIADRLFEVKRMTLTLAASTELSAQAAVDQLDRLREATEAVVFYTQFFQDNESNAIAIPILKKVANAWSYHPDFKEEWTIGTKTSAR